MSRPSLRVLVVDDNRSSAKALARVLSKGGDYVVPVFDGATAIDRLGSEPFDVVLTDLRMEPVSGMEVLAAARDLPEPIEVVVFTAYGAVDTAVRAMRLGARDFLTKPVTVEQVSARLDQLRGEADKITVDAEDTEDAGFVAESTKSKELLRTLHHVGQVPSHVWLEGEIGTGRSFAARFMHEAGPNRDSPMIIREPSSETTWPETGTVLLPSVDDLSLEQQRTLCRAIQALPEQVRCIATATPTAERKMQDGQLRPDLYYHLAVFEVTVPPLRERPEDLIPLFRRALVQFATKYRRPAPTLTDEQLLILKRHSWPGNIRELRNLAERTAVLGADAFRVSNYDTGGEDTFPELGENFNLASWMEQVERRILVEALRRTEGDRAAAGKLLGVERNTLRYKLNKYGLLDR